jgi:RNA binding exosome subunit
MPESPVRVRALRALVEFLRHEDNDRNLRSLWFAMLSRLLEQARGANRDQILTALEESHHGVMSLYARLERHQARRESSHRGIE